MSTSAKPPAIDPAMLTPRCGTTYPAPHDAPCVARERQVLGVPLGLTQFGVNILTLPPGAWSSQRHWHREEDEFVYVLEGEVVLITDAGEQVLTPGMAAGFPADMRDGHHLVNRTDRPARILEVGSRSPDEYVEYSDIDMKLERRGGHGHYMRKSGEPY